MQQVDKRTLSNEMFVLRTITVTKQLAAENPEASPIVGSFSFFSLLTHGEDPRNDIYWLTTTTLPIICSLLALRDHGKALPEVLTWHIYLRIKAALSWLTDTCQPGIAHGDVHEGYVLVGYTSPASDQQRLGLPVVKLNRLR